MTENRAENATIKCRICLLEVVGDEKFYHLNDNDDLMLKSKLLGFLPELDLTITENPVACCRCSVEIDRIHRFRYSCLQNEINLKNQTLLETSSKNILSLVEDECLLVNTDIPAWIEESKPNTIFYNCYECHYATNDKQNLTDHIFTHLFKCNRCTYTSLDKIAFTSHKEVHSNIKPLQCNICNYTCTEIHTLEEHMRTHLDGELAREKELENKSLNAAREHLFQCHDCDYQTDTKTSLKYHLATHKNIVKPRELQCKTRRTAKSIVPYSSAAHNIKIKGPKGKYSTSNRKNLNNHRMHNKTENFKQDSEKIIQTEENAIEPNWFECAQCNYKSNTKLNLIRHHRNVHAEQSFYCDTCDYSNTHLYKTKLHMKRYSGQSPLKCDKCDFKSHVMVHFMTHMKKHNPDGTFKCDKCNYITTSRGNFNAHSLIHAGKKRISCKWCAFRTYHNTNLRKHETLKHGKDFNCGDSSKFPIMNGQTDNIFKCEDCKYWTYVKAQFKRHLVTHAKDKRFACVLCDFTSFHKTSLRRHEKQHSTSSSNNKRFVCSVCGYKTSVKLHFDEHLRVHTGEKPFACKTCDYKSSLKRNVKTHEMRHCHFKT